VAYCKQKGMDPFKDDAAPIAKPIREMSREELRIRNEEATRRIELNRHVKSPDQIPMPTVEEQSKLYKENPQVTLFMELMEKSKTAQKAAPAPKKPWWSFLFASCSDPHDPYTR